MRAVGYGAVVVLTGLQIVDVVIACWLLLLPPAGIIRFSR